MTSSYATGGPITREDLARTMHAIRDQPYQPHQHLVSLAVKNGERPGHCIECGAYFDLRSAGA